MSVTVIAEYQAWPGNGDQVMAILAHHVPVTVGISA
jgi:hypothetical protein